jgi:hypothetical protein
VLLPRQAASDRSVRMHVRTASIDSNFVFVKLPRYSLSDLLSMMLGVSLGTVKWASATCGLPRWLSQLSS